jgi:hypothetical protein
MIRAMNEQQRWSAVWQAIDRRRISLGYTLARLYTESGVSEGTFRKMSHGVPLVNPAKRSQLCGALDWPADAIDRLLDGVDPNDIPPGDRPARRLAAGETPPLDVDLFARLVERMESAAGQLDSSTEMATRVAALEGEVRRLARALELVQSLVLDQVDGAAQPAAGTHAAP